MLLVRGIDMAFWPLSLKAPAVCGQSLNRKVIIKKASKYQEN